MLWTGLCPRQHAPRDSSRQAGGGGAYPPLANRRRRLRRALFARGRLQRVRLWPARALPGRLGRGGPRGDHRLPPRVLLRRWRWASARPRARGSRAPRGAAAGRGPRRRPGSPGSCCSRGGRAASGGRAGRPCAASASGSAAACWRRADPRALALGLGARAVLPRAAQLRGAHWRAAAAGGAAALPRVRALTRCVSADGRDQLTMSLLFSPKRVPLSSLPCLASS